MKIRLSRAGAKKRPYYRVVAVDERRKRDGRALEQLGTYDPIAKPVSIKLQADRIEAWRKNGAVVSDAVRALLRRSRQTGAGA